MQAMQVLDQPNFIPSPMCLFGRTLLVIELEANYMIQDALLSRLLFNNIKHWFWEGHLFGGGS